MHMTREILENGLQAYQAYRSSHLLTRWQLNTAVVALLVVNCWSSALIHRWFHSIVHIRVTGLAINFALDFVTSVIYPIIIFIPYYQVYDPKQGSFPIVNWYTDIWLAQLFQEAQMLLVTSLLDGLLKFFIGASVAASMQMLATLIDAAPTTTVDCVAQNNQGLGPKQGALHLASPTTSQKKIEASTNEHEQSGIVNPVASTSGRYESFGRNALAVFGCVILIVHGVAISRPTNEICKVQVSRLTKRSVCSLVEIHCNGDEFSEQGVNFDETLSTADEKWITFFNIRHCNGIDFSPSFKKLTNLVGFKIHNSTIRRWEADAAITATDHPKIRFVVLLDANMSALPVGLYNEDDFPSLLQDIEISKSNLTVLPNAIRDIWPQGLFFMVEQCQFSSFPMVALELDPWFLSVALNGFVDFPSELWENPGLFYLVASGNPLRRFPDSTTALGLGILETLSTEIDELPLWMDETMLSSKIRIKAGNTPLCERLNDVAQVQANATLQMWKRYVSCIPPRYQDDLRHFPLDHELILNP